MKNIKQYYKELGKMVYAIAAADGVITEAEKHTLHKFVLKDLVSRENSEDSSNMNQAFYVDFEFDDSAEQHRSPEECQRSFIRFVHSNFEPGDEKLLERSFHVLDRVSLAYSRKAERDLVESIKEEITELYKEK